MGLVMPPDNPLRRWAWYAVLAVSASLLLFALSYGLS